MGTSFSVKSVVESERLAEAGGWEDAVRGALDEVDATMSTWREDSDLSRLNDNESTEPQVVDRELIAILALATEVSERSGGAFDVTVGPLVDAWGFGPEAVPPTPPAADRLARLRESVGWELLELDHDAGTVRKLDGRVRGDLSAIAKGWAVDRVATALRELGHERFMVEVGGEVFAAGAKADGAAWRIAIEHPRADGREVHRVVTLDGLGLATSGDYRNYWQRDGVRYSHTIDPRTGAPVTHSLVSASVVDADTARADAWATALLVLGSEEGLAIAEREGLAALLLAWDGDTLTELSTTVFEAFAATGRLE